MANMEIGQFAGTAGPKARQQQVQHTQSMLCATVIGSVIIVVVAALFLTLF
jgi:hypothetical protein